MEVAYFPPQQNTWEEEREGKIGYPVTRAKIGIIGIIFAVYNFVNAYVKEYVLTIENLETTGKNCECVYIKWGRGT